jgi:hypothetical protein
MKKKKRCWKKHRFFFAILQFMIPFFIIIKVMANTDLIGRFSVIFMDGEQERYERDLE